MEGSQVADIQDKYLFSLTQLATVFGPARETITKRLNMAGVEPAGKRSSHSVYHIRQAARAIIEGEHGFTPFNGIDDPDKLPPKDRLDWFKSENERTKLEVSQSNLIDVVAHEVVLTDVIKLILQEVEPLADTLERKGVATVAAVECVEEAIDSLREKLALLLENYEPPS